MEIPLWVALWALATIVMLLFVHGADDNDREDR